MHESPVRSSYLASICRVRMYMLWLLHTAFCCGTEVLVHVPTHSLPLACLGHRSLIGLLPEHSEFNLRVFINATRPMLSAAVVERLPIHQSSHHAKGHCGFSESISRDFVRAFQLFGPANVRFTWTASSGVDTYHNMTPLCVIWSNDTFSGSDRLQSHK